MDTDIKQALFQALLDLMEVKPVKRISVVELTERAKVNRTSFYNYYDGIDDMVRKIETELSCELREALVEYERRGSSHESAARLLAFIFRFVAENSRIFSILLDPDGDYFVIKKTLELFAEYLSPAREGQRFIFPFITFGCVGIIQRWLLDGMKESPEDMAALTVSYIERGSGHLI